MESDFVQTGPITEAPLLATAPNSLAAPGQLPFFFERAFRRCAHSRNQRFPFHYPIEANRGWAFPLSDIALRCPRPRSRGRNPGAVARESHPGLRSSTRRGRRSVPTLPPGRSCLGVAAPLDYPPGVPRIVTNSATINRATSLPLLGAALLACVSHGAGPVITHEPDSKVVVMSDATGSLALRLNYNGRCLLEQVTVGGDDVVSPDTGVCSAIKVAGQWHTTRAGIPSPRVTVAVDNVTVDDIRYGAGSVQVRETWRFAVQRAGILWRIEREYLDGGTLEDTGFPVWDFRGMQTWTGALLGHGGVAWCKLFDKPDASYGVHNGEITCWNRNRRTCLRIVPRAPANDEHVAVRFSRQPGGIFSLYYSVTGADLPPRHGLSRFLHARQHVGAPFAVARGRVDIEFSLSAFDYDQAFDRGAFASLDSAAIRELCQTIARIGAVDERLHGSNGYYSDVAVLHEPWIAQLGLAIDDPAYFRAYADTLEFQRERALAPDGRVKSRWAGTPGDAIPGSYDANGFYEAQWGYLMDSQPSWVIN